MSFACHRRNKREVCLQLSLVWSYCRCFLALHNRKLVFLWVTSFSMGESPPHGHPSFHWNHVLWASLLLFMVIQVFSTMIAVFGGNLGRVWSLTCTWVKVAYGSQIFEPLLLWFAPQNDTLRVTSLQPCPPTFLDYCIFLHLGCKSVFLQFSQLNIWSANGQYSMDVAIPSMQPAVLQYFVFKFGFKFGKLTANSKDIVLLRKLFSM